MLIISTLHNRARAYIGLNEFNRTLVNQENNITIEVHACGASEIIEEFSKSEVFQDYNITWKAPDSTIGVRNNGELFLHPIKYYMRNKNGNLIDTGKSRAGHWRTYKYSGKELDRMHGLDMFDHGATAATDELRIESYELRVMN